MYHYTFGHEYSEEGVPQFDSKHGEWSFDKRNFQRYMPLSLTLTLTLTPTLPVTTAPAPAPAPGHDATPNQVPAAQPATAAPLRPGGGARSLLGAPRRRHQHRRLGAGRAVAR
jgi:hypothetical protein